MQLPHALNRRSIGLLLGPFLWLLLLPAVASGQQDLADLEVFRDQIDAMIEAMGEDVGPAPEGQTEDLACVVLKSKGHVRVRTLENDRWRKPKLDEEYPPGTSFKTIDDSWVAVRVGYDNTILLDRRTEVALPTILKDGATLRTKVALVRGRVDIKKDRDWAPGGDEAAPPTVVADAASQLGGPRNKGMSSQTEVTSGSATLAMRGTAFAVQYGGFWGTEVMAARTNAIRAIELQYFIRQLRQYTLSGGAISSDKHKNPPVASFFETLGPPDLIEDDVPHRDLIYWERLSEINDGDPGDPPTECPDFMGSGRTCAFVASLIENVADDLFSCYDDSLTLAFGGNFDDMDIEDLKNQVVAKVAMADVVTDEIYDDILRCIEAYCADQHVDVEDCTQIFLDEVGSFIPPN